MRLTRKWHWSKEVRGDAGNLWLLEKAGRTGNDLEPLTTVLRVFCTQLPVQVLPDVDVPRD
ncbi:MAG: hypothetical protein HPY44_15870 [Armatimonadetes bacterium]|nr:hypothetical protein [Armatimonadota bacterium]